LVCFNQDGRYQAISCIYEVITVTDTFHPPKNCQWWSVGDQTRNPPDDNEFLTTLAGAGFRTFIAEGGLFGATRGNRMVDVVHRGFGRRWEMGFIQDNEEVHSEIVTSLPSHVDAVVGWLETKPLEYVIRLLHRESGDGER
jgi:hypothetical protein